MKTSPQLKIGLLGSGQLARMLALRAHSLGIQPFVYGGKSTDPAAQVTSRHYEGDLKDAKRLQEFLERVDIATFESEFMDGALLAELSRKTRTPIYPDPLQMEKLQDRWTQKQLLQEHKLPTSPFFAVSTLEETHAAWAQLKTSQVVLKKRKFGYDGYGTFILKSEADLKESLFRENLQGFIAESFVPFKRELAVSAVRNPQGEVVFLPLVESFQKDSRCFWVKGPVRHKDLKALKRKIKRFLNELEYVGIMAFELFETSTGLLINEIAPRVHNSAHYSLDALSEDQFQLHLEAVIGRKLKEPTTLTRGFAMVNLLGSSSHAPKWSDISEGQIHWYGKLDNRPGRKMGHLNCRAENPTKALKTALKTLKEIQL